MFKALTGRKTWPIFGSFSRAKLSSAASAERRKPADPSPALLPTHQLLQCFDVCNGNADGLTARHQYRLSFPLPAERVTFFTGLKRRVALLLRVETQFCDPNNTDICVFDISYDQNAASA